MTDSASTEATTCTEHEVQEVAQANATGKQPVRTPSADRS
jgi:hypothetical protein